jgi:prolyl oligopeptidase
VLTGYGGFNIAKTPTFFESVIPWVLAGGIYAMANLRGGSEYGEEWHKAGMRENKQNVFDDFIAAGHFLVDHGFTQRSQLGIWGRSNGGLLVGAALTQKPDSTPR